MSVRSNRKLILGALGIAYASVLPVILVAYDAVVAAEEGVAAPLALRDLVMGVAGWGLLGLLVVGWVARNIDRGGRQLANLAARIAEGDWKTTIPMPEDPVLADAALGMRQALERFERRDRLRISRLQETRGLIRRLLELGDAPVVVIGIHAQNRLTLDYSNKATSEAFGESLESMEGVVLEEVPGGDSLKVLAERILSEGSAHLKTSLEEEMGPDASLIADCAVVRNRVGMPVRLVVILKKVAEKAWWRRVWEGAARLEEK